MATLSQLVDPEGYWSPQMVELMMNEVVAIETREKKALSEATQAAIGASFSKKVGGTYQGSLDDVLHLVEDARRARRGMKPAKRENEDVKTVRKMLGRPRRKK